MRLQHVVQVVAQRHFELGNGAGLRLAVGPPPDEPGGVAEARALPPAIGHLGDTFRPLLYASLAALLFAGAAAGRWWDSGPLTVLWLVVFAAGIYGLVATYRHWRSY